MFAWCVCVCLHSTAALQLEHLRTVVKKEHRDVKDLALMFPDRSVEDIVNRAKMESTVQVHKGPWTPEV